MIPTEHITGVILSGGEGRRMGGVDKGLQNHLGTPLVQHALQRLSPQVGSVLINANRNLDRYAVFGAPVWPDAATDRLGPLAGLLAGLAHCNTPYLVTVPCDAPNFPVDVVARLAAELVAQQAHLAIAATRSAHAADGIQLQPVFCLVKASVRPHLVDFVATGQRQITRWAALQRCTTVVFDDEAAFANVNTLQELDQLQMVPIRPSPP